MSEELDQKKLNQNNELVEDTKVDAVEMHDESNSTANEKSAANEKSEEKDSYKTYLKVYEKFVDGIQFSLLSPETIKKMASVKVVTHELYDSEGYPVDGGLMDLRMGVIDPGLRCRTCGGTIKECLGHFGYIELARPVLHIKFVGLISNLLKSTCSVCGRPLLTDEEIKQYKAELHEIMENEGLSAVQRKIREISHKMKDKHVCPHCHAKQKKIVLEKPYNFYEEDRRLTPTEIRARLEKIPDDDLILFGMNPNTSRPEWTVLTVLPVPPVTMRPSITLQTGERSEDDLTHKLSDIVRFNQRLFENINAGAPEAIIEDLWDLLQYHVATFFDNSVSQLLVARHRSGQPLKSIVERIKSKQGRLRRNLAGKRVNFSARSVISPDPKIAFDQLGVPKVIAKILTVPVRVTDWNIDYAKKFVENAENYPGANYVIRPDGALKKVTSETKELLLEEIKPGYVVERHLMNGDIVLFNRHPSLHRLSLMAHVVKIVDGRTFRLNPAVCMPYNADFDGDEMNIHVPQTEEAQAEARMLLYIPHNIVSPKNGSIVVGPELDSTVGNYLLTNNMTISRKEAIELLGSIGITDFSRLPDGDTLKGSDLYSCILPPDFNFEGPTKQYRTPEDKNNPLCWLKIKNGRIVFGVLDSMNTRSGAMVKKLHKEYGEEKTIEILFQLEKLGLHMTHLRGLTSAISHYQITPEVKKEIDEILDDAKKNTDDLIKQYHEGTLELLPGKSLRDTLELKILQVLNEARNDIGDAILRMNKADNDLILMINSGAKGSAINVAQISGIVGQQSLRGKRISIGYKDRVLPHFKRGDLSPEARGFIKGNYYSGMRPEEFFFQAITGRDSLMDKGMRTPTSGYLYRRMSNALQDIKVEYDLTVRDSSNSVVQFRFGDDGMDVSKTESGRLNVKRIIYDVMTEDKN